MNVNDRLELWTAAGQALVLSAGFALVFSWDADFAPKALFGLILTLLVLIYPMPDRLKNVLQREFREIQKANSLTQAMILELRETIPDKSESMEMSSDEKLAKAQDIAETLESLQLDFDKSFEEAFWHQRRVTDADRIDFLGNAVGIIVYLAGLIGGSALIGWLISVTF